FVKPPSTPSISTLSLHDALPIFEIERGDKIGDILLVRDGWLVDVKRLESTRLFEKNSPGMGTHRCIGMAIVEKPQFGDTASNQRSEEHTSELQSPYDLVCRLLLE